MWTPFRDTYEVDTLDRVGLRYINRIVLPSGHPLDWDGYIDRKLTAATLEVPGPGSPSLARSMHTIFWHEDDYRIKFQFGIHNSDFPNPVAKREFILDYDCFSVGPVDAADAPNCLVSYNKLIESLFEQSIGDKLREDMRTGERTPHVDPEGG